jgi:hypothetical protein
LQIFQFDKHVKVRSEAADTRFVGDFPNTRPYLPPAYFPVLAIIAVVVTMVTLGTWNHPAPGAASTNTLAPGTPGLAARARAGIHLYGTLRRLTRTSEQRVQLTLNVPAGPDMHLSVDGSRVIVPEGGVDVVGALADLKPGQQLDVELMPGTTYQPSAPVATVRVVGGAGSNLASA